MQHLPGVGRQRGRGLLLLLALIATACSPAVSPSPVISPSPPPNPTPLPTTVVPTPVPTPDATSLPTASVAPATGELLIRLTGCSHTCGPEAGTTILEDGRMIWQDAELRTLEAQLTSAAQQQVRDAITSAGGLDADADVQAELRPGAEPAGHGVSLYRFERILHGQRVVVTSGDPRDYADQAELWIIPPELGVLAELADRLRDPVTWLGPDGLAEPAHRYRPDHYLVLVDLFPEVGGAGDFEVDVDTVPWPFGAPIEGVGEPTDGGAAGLGSRCLVIDVDDAAETAAAEKGAGINRDLGAWLSTAEYGWKRANGFVQVAMTPLLPHQSGTCAELVATDPSR